MLCNPPGFIEMSSCMVPLQTDFVRRHYISKARVIIRVLPSPVCCIHQTIALSLYTYDMCVTIVLTVRHAVRLVVHVFRKMCLLVQAYYYSIISTHYCTHDVWEQRKH